PDKVAVPWQLLSAAGRELVFATEGGGAMPTCDGRSLRGIVPGRFGASSEVRASYGRLEQAVEFRNSIRWLDNEPGEFDGLVLPGGHAPGMRQYLVNRIPQATVASFWRSQRPVGAICPRRTTYPPAGDAYLFARQFEQLLESVPGSDPSGEAHGRCNPRSQAGLVRHRPRGGRSARRELGDSSPVAGNPQSKSVRPLIPSLAWRAELISTLTAVKRRHEPMAVALVIGPRRCVLPEPAGSGNSRPTREGSTDAVLEEIGRSLSPAGGAEQLVPAQQQGSLDGLAGQWWAALDSAHSALRAAGNCLGGQELGERSRRLAQERGEIVRLLRDLGRELHTDSVLVDWLATPGVTPRWLGLPGDVVACVFDLDGVLTTSSTVHAAAWAETLDPFLLRRAERGRRAFMPFDRR